MRIYILLLCLVALKTYAQDDPFKTGRYYDKKGKMVTGFIDLSEVLRNTLRYKPTLNGVVEELRASALKGFVVESDSFIMIRNFVVESTYSNSYSNTVGLGLGRVLETGKVVLYQVYYTDRGGTGGYNYSPSYSSGLNKALRNTFLVRQDGSNKVMEAEMGIDDFVKQMNEYFRMSPEICKRITNKEYSYLKVQQLVKDFNEWHRNR